MSSTRKPDVNSIDSGGRGRKDEDGIRAQRIYAACGDERAVGAIDVNPRIEQEEIRFDRRFD
jgi:hypothetical protein